MSLIIECTNCGQKNKVEANKLKLAVCGSCKENLLENEHLPIVVSDDEIAAAVATAPSRFDESEVDTQSWTSKIGDHEQQVNYVKKGFWSKVKKYAAKVPFAHEAVAMYYCAMDPGTPNMAKVTAIGALAYWILPIDLIPDFLPVVGFADDATAIIIAYKAISVHITDEHRQQADQFFAR